MILSLKSLNESAEDVHLQMASLACAVQLIKQNCHMSSVDLKAAYYSVRRCLIAHEQQIYLRFLWRNQLYQYTRLPNV